MANMGNVHVSAAEARGARKLLSALKRNGLVRKSVRLAAGTRKENPARGPKRLHARAFAPNGDEMAKRRLTIRRQLRKQGFHVPAAATLAQLREMRRKVNGSRSTVVIARRARIVKVNSSKKRVSKKQAFLNRMRLGKLRAKRRRAR